MILTLCKKINLKNNDSKEPKVITFNFNPDKETKKTPYGGLFKK